jgi:hypothetical protein
MPADCTHLCSIRSMCIYSAQHVSSVLTDVQRKNQAQIYGNPVPILIHSRSAKRVCYVFDVVRVKVSNVSI